MWGLELTVQITRFACVVVLSIVVGIVVSTLLAALAWRSGYNADLVFNITGPLSTTLAFVGFWRGKFAP
ncbi:MAG TPA: hypothetical protein G4O02_11685 [Caldilineae bacterium]|jgi:cation transporter-like permease|nr:hypothetical protein [Caldilineae bacterium]